MGWVRASNWLLRRVRALIAYFKWTWEIVLGEMSYKYNLTTNFCGKNKWRGILINVRIIFRESQAFGYSNISGWPRCVYQHNLISACPFSACHDEVIYDLSIKIHH